MRRGTLSSLLFIVGTSSLIHAKQEALNAVSQGNNLFSTDLYDVLRKSNDHKNLIVSPLSVSTALAMLQAGAREKTADAIRSILHFPTDDQLNAGYQTLHPQLRSNENITLEMVNRIYPAEGYPLHPQFTNTLKNNFGAEPHQLNFFQSVHAAGEINSFVSKATHDKVRDLVQPGDLSYRTRLVIINAIYFKGQWNHQFAKENTTKQNFYTTATDSVKVDMMRLETDLYYGEIPELDAKAVSLPYRGEDGLSMIILLPNKRTGLIEMEDKLKSVPLNKIIQSMVPRKVTLHLPRFKLESTIDLEDPLTDLGLGVIFDSVGANLSGILAENTEQLYVTKVLQKAFIEVNEEGSEAAAATKIIIGHRTGSVPKVVDLIVNHPYSFILLKETGNIPITLFAGRVTKLGP